jgi:cytochrome P450 / NADPH-cytochrome P450 reductase
MSKLNPLAPIPHPPRLPGVGNALSIDTTRPTQHLMEVARTLGPIFWLDILGKPIIVVSNHALVHELCDETRFEKSVKGVLRNLRAAAGDGLFTAYPREPNWQKAHNVLVPAFALRSMVSHHSFMLDIAQQLVVKWSRLNADDEINVARDMTSLTLDTIGLAGFGYRFNSFYRESDHPFVAAMVRSLDATMKTRGLPLEGWLNRGRDKQLGADITYMHGVVDRIVAERKTALAQSGCPHALTGASPEAAPRPAQRNDLMNFMLTRPDRATGETLDDAQIRYQTITFLIAGHETTSGLLSFALYFLMRHPQVMARARAEAERVFGRDPATWPGYGEVNQLDYIKQVLKEALRLWPTAPAIAVTPVADTVIGGAYPMPKGAHVVLLLPSLHRDPEIWGPNAEAFNPDHFTPEAEAARPIHAYKAFGNGARQCIGRQFALHEAALVLGLILQRFDLHDHADYQLVIKETLTLKPDGFRIRVFRCATASAATAAPTVSSPY